MLVTLSGIVIDVSESQLENAAQPIDVTLSGIVIDLSDVQLSNANSPMLVTLSGIKTSLSDLHFSNAMSPIAVTLQLRILDGIIAIRIFLSFTPVIAASPDILLTLKILLNILYVPFFV